MRNTAKFLAVGVFALLAAGPISGQAPAPQAPAPAAPQQPTFRVNVDLVTTDVIPRDSRDQFVSDLKPEEIEIYEDGVKQTVASFVLTHGGRVYNVMSPPPAPAREGIILPPARPRNDIAGRVILIFIDDLHLDCGSTPRLRSILKDALRQLIHEGDMYGIVTTGTSSISQQLTYDRQILEHAIDRMTGGGLRPDQIINGQESSQGPTEVRYRAHVAFSTMYDLLKNLEQLKNRRKAVLYVSSGYDFNPFQESRNKAMAQLMGVEDESELQNDPFLRSTADSQRLSEGDLFRELREITRAANRANATLYTIDPRGLVSGPDVDQTVSVSEWNAFVRDSQDTLRTLAEDTGGIAVVNQNDFRKALTLIDNETSDYYVLGYYSTNPDPLHRNRKIDVKINRPGVTAKFRTGYSLRLPPPPATP
jgi:VWFA-related protein